MFELLLPLLCSVVTGHKEYHAACPPAISSKAFTENLLRCYEVSDDHNKSEETCLVDAMMVFRNLEDSACLKCIEHFVEDHLIDELTRCPSSYLSTGMDRDECVSMIVDSIEHHCY